MVLPGWMPGPMSMASEFHFLPFEFLLPPQFHYFQLHPNIVINYTKLGLMSFSLIVSPEHHVKAIPGSPGPLSLLPMVSGLVCIWEVSGWPIPTPGPSPPHPSIRHAPHCGCNIGLTVRFHSQVSLCGITMAHVWPILSFLQGLDDSKEALARLNGCPPPHPG